MTSFWQEKRILITGVAGTVGQELLRQLSGIKGTTLVGIDTNENGISQLEKQYDATLAVCDIRDQSALRQYMQGCDIVLHAAALKYEDLCEEQPDLALAVNVDGVRNVIAAAQELGVGRVISTSSVKAVHPSGVMGATKLLGEKLMQATTGDTIFSVVRFCNVLGSSGSVIPVFEKQIAAGGPVTITDPGMSRYGMSLEDSARLILEAAEQATGGEILVPKAFAWRIADLAHVMIETLAPEKEIEIVETGLRPGEKLYDELLSEEESASVIDRTNFLVIMPEGSKQQNENESAAVSLTSEYFNSGNATPAGKAELAAFLHTHALLNTNQPSSNPKNKQGEQKCA